MTATLAVALCLAFILGVSAGALLERARWGRAIQREIKFWKEAAR